MAFRPQFQSQLLLASASKQAPNVEGIQELTDEELASVNGAAPLFLVFRLLMLFSTSAH
jgi:hypothetical protein